MYLTPSTTVQSPSSASPNAPIPEDTQESPDTEGGLPYFTVSQIMAGSNLSKPNIIPESSTSIVRPISSVSSRSSISYVEPYIPLSVLTSISPSSVALSSNSSSPAYATPLTFETFQSASSSTSSSY